jgi:hypothetical protein
MGAVTAVGLDSREKAREVFTDHKISPSFKLVAEYSDRWSGERVFTASRLRENFESKTREPVVEYSYVLRIEGERTDDQKLSVIRVAGEGGIEELKREYSLSYEDVAGTSRKAYDWWAKGVFIEMARFTIANIGEEDLGKKIVTDQEAYKAANTIGEIAKLVRGIRDVVRVEPDYVGVINRNGSSVPLTL